MKNRLRAALIASFGVALIGLAAQSASAATVTFSGTGLSGLDYRDNGGTAQYVAGTPDVAFLSTPDSGLTGGAPVVYVNAANAGLSSLGTLDSFSASYDLYSYTGPVGTGPYWLTYLNDPNGGYVGVISFGGPDLNSSSQIHVFCDYASSTCNSTFWGDSLSTLYSTAYGSTTFGQLAVYESGVEIGDWNNNGAIIPASADIQSITITAAVPEPETYAMLLAGLGLLGFFGRRRKRQETAAA